MDKRHWPAKILESVVPLAPGPMLYSIQWMDNTKGTIPREQFYTYEEEGFGLCEIGKFESVFNEVVNDTDDDRPAPPRSTRLSPEPHNPPPTADVFCDLPVHDQFVHTKPVLQAILRDEFPPARVAHTKFIGGGNGRNDIVKNAGERGLLDPRDVSEFLACLKEWCLRGMEMDERAVEEEEEQAETKEIVAEVLKLEDDMERAPSQAAVALAMDTEDDVGNLFDTSSTLSEASDVSDLVRFQKLGRQIGCPAYEGLSTVEKMDYCLNVLLPELLGQICLWRIGRRTSVALLSPEEELELHTIGKEEKRKTDWVFDVKRMRTQKEKELGKGDKSAGGSKSRPRRKR
ncbi:hypothetical protein C8R43DRAFT_891891 [Mycena crocata]|nr:hypothetical protein C8R43DRAFT_891891 [Mycena crocata]